MKIYTKTGDSGSTSLVGGTRVSKADARLEAYGTVDELNAHIGVLLACEGVPQSTRDTLTVVQNKLFNLGAELATEPDSRWKPQGIVDEDVAFIERAIDAVDTTLPRHNQFILPAGTMGAAQAHVARTVARRAERRMVAMQQAGVAVSDKAMAYINRLSDYLFVVARQINVANKKEEIFWDKTC